MERFRMLQTVYGLKKCQRFTRAQMVVYQTDMLRNLVGHAWRWSPFYREYYSDHGLKEADLVDIGVGDLPATDKELLMENFDRVVTDERTGDRRDGKREISKGPGSQRCGPGYERGGEESARTAARSANGQVPHH